MESNNLYMNNVMNLLSYQNDKINRQMTLTRLMREFQLCKLDDDLSDIGCTFGLYPGNNYFKWRVTMFGPEDSPYKGGIFTIQIIFPEDYPKRGAEFKFMNKIYHLNVDPKNGHISLNSLNEWRYTGKVMGKKVYGVKQALFDIFYLFYNQGIDSPYSDEMAVQYRDKPEKFNKLAQEWTKEYAKLPNE